MGVPSNIRKSNCSSSARLCAPAQSTHCKTFRVCVFRWVWYHRFCNSDAFLQAFGFVNCGCCIEVVLGYFAKSCCVRVFQFLWTRLPTIPGIKNIWIFLTLPSGYVLFRFSVFRLSGTEKLFLQTFSYLMSHRETSCSLLVSGHCQKHSCGGLATK